jgi:hypothetical protein
VIVKMRANAVLNILLSMGFELNYERFALRGLLFRFLDQARSNSLDKACLQLGDSVTVRKTGRLRVRQSDCQGESE